MAGFKAVHVVPTFFFAGNTSCFWLFHPKAFARFKFIFCKSKEEKVSFLETNGNGHWFWSYRRKDLGTFPGCVQWFLGSSPNPLVSATAVWSKTQQQIFEIGWFDIFGPYLLSEIKKNAFSSNSFTVKYSLAHNMRQGQKNSHCAVKKVMHRKRVT